MNRGNGEWLGVSNNPRNNKSSPTVIMRQLRFINITGRSENGGLLSGITGAGVEDVHFENIHINIGACEKTTIGSVSLSISIFYHPDIRSCDYQ